MSTLATTQPTLPSMFDPLESLNPEQREVALHDKGPLLVVAVAGSGKCLGRGTPVLMFDGSIRPVEDVKNGDILMGPDSTPRTVESTTIGNGPMYRIDPVKGMSWECNDVHIMTLVGTNKQTGKIIDVPLNEFIERGGLAPESVAGRRKPGRKLDKDWKLLRVGVEFPSASVPFDPYLVGLWLGDGTTEQAAITNCEPEIIEYCKIIAASAGTICVVTDTTDRNNSYAIRFTAKENTGSADAGAPNFLRRYLRSACLSGKDKIIPREYMINSREIRLAVLAGILDTADGCVTGGNYDYISKSKLLADAVVFICRSLGLAAYTHPKVCGIKSIDFEGTYHRVSISGDLTEIPFKVARRKVPARKQIKRVTCTGWTATPIGDGEYFGFTLDGDGRFLLGDFTVTHNTTAVIRRSAYLTRVRGVPPERILMLTFTRKAASEMQARLDGLIGKSRVKICTAHVLAWSIMREEYGITDKNYDKGQVRFIVKKYCEKNKIDPNVLLRFMGLAKNELAGPTNARALGIAQDICRNAHPKITDPLAPAALVTAYVEVEKQRIEMQIYTHDDALFYAVAEFYRNDVIRQKWASRYDYVTQDEKQDESMAQMKLIEMLVSHGNYVAIGDVAQCVYLFRGAHPERTTSFTTDWPGARVIRMHRNYRSATPIIAAANHALRRMPDDQRLSGEITGERSVEGNVEIDAYDTIDDQARGIATRVLAGHAAGKPWSDFAVLYRVRSLERAVEEAFVNEKIPHVVIGGTSFYDRAEIRDLLAYCRLATGVFDADDVKNCINSPTRYLKKEFGRAVMDHVKEGKSWVEATERACSESKLWKKAQVSAIEWAMTVEGMAEAEQKAVAAAEWIETPESPEKPEAENIVRMLTDLVSQIGYDDYLRKTNGNPSIENDSVSVVREFVGSCQRFRTLRELITHADSMRKMHKKQQKDEAGKAMLMTVHGGKGLEFDTVFLAGCIDNIMPHKLAESKDEEARLFYVATTRAKNHLIYCTFAEYNGFQTQPSRYLTGIRLTTPYNRIRRPQAGDGVADASARKILPEATISEAVETKRWKDLLSGDSD